MASLARLVLVFVALATGCVFNTSLVERVKQADSPGAVTSVHADVRQLGFVVQPVQVRGGDRTDAHAELVVRGSAPQGASLDAIDAAMTLAWDDAMAPLMALDAGYDGRFAETVWVESLAIEVPRTAEVELDATDAHLVVSDVDVVRAHGAIGDIDVTGATSAELTSDQGTITVQAETATVTTQSGGVALDVRGEVHVESANGSVQGSIGDGGSITTTAGGIRVDLTGPLTRDLELTSDLGEIALRVSRDASLELDLESGNGVHVEAGGIVHHGQARLTERLGEGGFVVVARSAGTIRVEEL